MSYSDHFKLTDDLINHLDPVLAAISDPFIESRYTGFLATSSVTVLELSLKSIFCDFAAKKHKVLGNFCTLYFERINGRIGLDQIRNEYLPKFGSKYQKRFLRKMEYLENRSLRANGVSLKCDHANLLVWRNSFAHAGIVPSNATYAEVKRAYASGKQVMHCLASCMNR